MKKYFLLISFFVLPATADNPTCGENGVIELMALFNPKTITCSENQFLPANSLTCSNCPNGYSCSGGELTFDEHKSSGIDFTVKITNNANNVCATNFPRELYALWKLKNVTCTPGYYLPANVDSCTICPQNNYCVGGTYSFNETSDQGIEQCVNGHAPVGSSVCYGHILHIGEDVVYLKSTKTTTPSLNVGMDDGIFYANMTTTPTPMNAATEHFLKIEYDGTVYYVCDDTTYTQ